MKELVARPSWIGCSALLLGAVLASCAAPGVDDVALPEQEEIVLDDGEQAEFDILGLLRDLELANTNDDAEAVAALYAEDSMWSMPDGTVLRGLAEIRKTCEDLFRSYDVSMELRVASLEVDGSTARVLGSMSIELRTLGGDSTESLRDRFIMVLRRDEVGPWRIWRLAWTSAG